LITSRKSIPHLSNAEFGLKHLNRGVAKGAFSQEEADKRWAAWIDAKENKISERRDSHKAEKAAKHKSIHGEAKAKPVVVEEAPAVEEVVETIDETVNATEEVAVEVATPEVVETPVVEEAPAVVEEVVETPVAEEAPVAETPVAEAEEAPVAEEPVQENPEASTEEEEKA
jgi:small subunit ribosomal protein S16